MRYYSTNKKSAHVSFRQAIMQGLAPDKGLYFPKNIPLLPQDFFTYIQDITTQEIAFQVARAFVGDEIPENDLYTIIKEAINFDIPLVAVEENIFSLELFHGPTLAFKDVGARFMSRMLNYFLRQEKKMLTILVATSGDTGAAVAAGFWKMPNIKVIILYPSGKVSYIQEKQLTTYGENIAAYEVAGTFDDCQGIVKCAFIDEDLQRKFRLTSANSINIGRLIPQAFYYFFAYQQIKDRSMPLVISVPSGNFGNISAGLIAKRMGVPIDRFIAATNVNDTVPVYLSTGVYEPSPSKKTIANAMDVGNPSNFSRIQELCKHQIAYCRDELSGHKFTDDQIKAAIKSAYEQAGYLLDPHGAIGYMALKIYQKDHSSQGIFLETAHPAKFFDVLEPVLEKTLEMPPRLAAYLEKPKRATFIQNTFKDFKNELMKH